MRWSEHGAVLAPPSYLDVVEVEHLQVGVVLPEPLDRLLRVGHVGRLGRHRLGPRGACDARPADVRLDPLSQQRGVVLVLVHHRVEAQDRCRRDTDRQRADSERPEHI